MNEKATSRKKQQEREPESEGVEGRETDGQKEEGRDRWERRGGV